MGITYQSSNNDILRALKNASDPFKVEYYRELLVLKNRKLVSSAINQYAGIFNRDDMYQEGMITLLAAIDSFDVERSSVEFSTYVTRAIRNNVANISNSTKSVVTVPVDFNHHKISIDRARTQYFATHHRVPTVRDLAEMTGLCEERVKTIINAYDFTGTMSLDEVVGDEEAPLYEIIPASDPEPQLDLDKLKDLLMTLSDNEVELLMSFFGAFGEEKNTANELLKRGVKTAEGKDIISKQSIHNHIKYAIAKARRTSKSRAMKFDDYFSL